MTAGLCKGTDLSSFITVVNWGQLLTDGYGTFTTVRACDGITADTMHATHVKNGVKNSVPVGSYQYGEPTLHDPEECADVFLKIVNAVHAPPGLRIRHVIDMETLSKTVKGVQIVPANAGVWTDAWCEIVKYKSKTEPIVYASKFYWEEMCRQVPTLGGSTGWDWWMAWYTGTPNKPKTPLPYIAHQYAGDVKLTNQVGLWDLDVVYDDSAEVLKMPADAPPLAA